MDTFIIYIHIHTHMYLYTQIHIYIDGKKKQIESCTASDNQVNHLFWWPSCFVGVRVRVRQRQRQ